MILILSYLYAHCSPQIEGESVTELKQAFHDAVEDYIEICRENSKDVFKSYKGSFNVRIDPQLHRKISESALLKGLSLNQLVQTALEHELALTGPS